MNRSAAGLGQIDEQIVPAFGELLIRCRNRIELTKTKPVENNTGLTPSQGRLESVKGHLDSFLPFLERFVAFREVSQNIDGVAGSRGFLRGEITPRFGAGVAHFDVWDQNVQRQADRSLYRDVDAPRHVTRGTSTQP